MKLHIAFFTVIPVALAIRNGVPEEKLQKAIRQVSDAYSAKPPPTASEMWKDTVTKNAKDALQTSIDGLNAKIKGTIDDIMSGKLDKDSPNDVASKLLAIGKIVEKLAATAVENLKATIEPIQTTMIESTRSKAEVVKANYRFIIGRCLEAVDKKGFETTAENFICNGKPDKQLETCVKELGGEAKKPALTMVWNYFNDALHKPRALCGQKGSSYFYEGPARRFFKSDYDADHSAYRITPEGE